MFFGLQAFFSMFRDACDVKLKAENFAAGICQAFFNSSKNLCKLEGASEDEVQVNLWKLCVFETVLTHSV